MSQRPDFGTRRPDRAALIVAALLAAFGGVLVWDAARLADLGGYSGVGPAGMPKLVGGGLILLSLWTAWDAWRGNFPERDRQEFGPVLWIIGGLVAQLVLLKPVGFSIATGLLFAMTARGFGNRRLWFSIPVGIVFAFAVWTVFSQLLMLHLPAGPLERIFFPGAK